MTETLGGPEGVAYRGKDGCTWLFCTRDPRNPDRCYGWHCLLCDEPTDAQGGHTCKAVGSDHGDRLREAFEEYASHASWRCDHPDRYPWEPDCPCGLTKVCREFGIETHND